MAKFNASDIEVLEYDFEKFGGGSGEINEPTTARVNGFFRDMKNMFKEVQSLQAQAKGMDVEVEEMDDEALAEAVGKVDEAEAGASEIQQRMIENLAVLCGGEFVDDGVGQQVVVGGAPSLDALNTLPYRHLQAFSKWLIGEISPKKTTPGSNG